MDTPFTVQLHGRRTDVLEVTSLAKMPKRYVTDVRSGDIKHDLSNVVFNCNKHSRRVYWDGAPFLLYRGEKTRLAGEALRAFEAEFREVWRACDVPARVETFGRRLGDVVSSEDVESVSKWPLGSVKTNVAEGEGWTDCVLNFVEEVKIGGKYNSRRVRYNGRFFVTFRGRRVFLVGELVFKVLECASWVYGLDSEEDREYNKKLKGY